MNTSESNDTLTPIAALVIKLEYVEISHARQELIFVSVLIVALIAIAIAAVSPGKVILHCLVFLLLAFTLAEQSNRRAFNKQLAVLPELSLAPTKQNLLTAIQAQAGQMELHSSDKILWPVSTWVGILWLMWVLLWYASYLILFGGRNVDPNRWVMAGYPMTCIFVSASGGNALGALVAVWRARRLFLARFGLDTTALMIAAGFNWRWYSGWRKPTAARKKEDSPV
jgi:hypothetical protein